MSTYMIDYQGHRYRFGPDPTKPITSASHAVAIASQLVARGGGDAVIYEAVSTVRSTTYPRGVSS